MCKLVMAIKAGRCLEKHDISELLEFQNENGLTLEQAIEKFFDDFIVRQNRQKGNETQANIQSATHFPVIVRKIVETRCKFCKIGLAEANGYCVRCNSQYEAWQRAYLRDITEVLP